MGLNIKPLADRVVVEPAAAEEKTAGGIIIPDTAKEKPQKGKVLAVGNGKPDEPMTVKVGERLINFVDFNSAVLLCMSRGGKTAYDKCKHIKNYQLKPLAERVAKAYGVKYEVVQL